MTKGKLFELNYGYEPTGAQLNEYVRLLDEMNEKFNKVTEAESALKEAQTNFWDTKEELEKFKRVDT